MVLGCLVCNNLFLYRYLNPNKRCPFCYLMTTSHLLFESLVQLFQGHAMKTVVLGESSPRAIPVLEDRHDPYEPMVRAKVHGVAKPFESLSWDEEGEKGIGEVAKPKKARKTVSINHEVEYIDDYLSSKKRKRKMMEQWPSMEIEGDGIKPLKSILKVGSNQIR
ncbi:hypothetical protein QVD17_09416 [Tagetes erecta]|uniref:Uncharacterized protein n=1 Tax=Tagetes erecta TaxID=13708 RepID=A0AAD8L1F9_TARER|nr:hypothetical protein QVD17_09416 [Tagetes erecta]